jgi:hypothetical protein
LLSFFSFFRERERKIERDRDRETEKEDGNSAKALILHRLDEAGDKKIVVLPASRERKKNMLKGEIEDELCCCCCCQRIIILTAYVVGLVIVGNLRKVQKCSKIQFESKQKNIVQNKYRNLRKFLRKFP